MINQENELQNNTLEQQRCHADKSLRAAVAVCVQKTFCHVHTERTIQRYTEVQNTLHVPS